MYYNLYARYKHVSIGTCAMCLLWDGVRVRKPLANFHAFQPYVAKYLLAWHSTTCCCSWFAICLIVSSMFDHLFHVSSKDHYQSGYWMATQCWTMASWIILCPDICPDSLFLTVGAYYSDSARHQWISVEVKLVSHVECDARDYDVGIIKSNHCICTYTLYTCEWWPPSHPPKIEQSMLLMFNYCLVYLHRCRWRYTYPLFSTVHLWRWTSSTATSTWKFQAHRKLSSNHAEYPPETEKCCPGSDSKICHLWSILLFWWSSFSYQCGIIATK